MSRAKKSRKNLHRSPRDIRYIMGRVVTSPKKFDNKPFVIGTSVLADDVVPLLEQKASNRAVKREFPALSKRDIRSIRAYRARWRPDTMAGEFNDSALTGNVFLVDENTSYKWLPHIVRNFGLSTHTSAEGLGGKDDEGDLWAFALKQGYRAILTKDDDFVEIAKRRHQHSVNKFGSVFGAPRPMPVVFHIPNEYNTKLDIAELLDTHKDAILELIIKRDAPYAVLHTDHFEKGPLFAVSPLTGAKADTDERPTKGSRRFNAA